MARLFFLYVFFFFVSFVNAKPPQKDEVVEDFLGTGLTVLTHTRDTESHSTLMRNGHGTSFHDGVMAVEPDFRNFVVKAKQNIKVLELGPGFGGTLERVDQALLEAKASTKVEYILVEIDPDAVAALKAYKPKYPHLRINVVAQHCHAYLKDLWQTSQGYDVVFAGRSLHFLRPQEHIGVLMLLGCHMKPGARFFLTQNDLILPSDDPVRMGFEERKRQKKLYPGVVISRDAMGYELLRYYHETSGGMNTAFQDKVRTLFENQDGMTYPRSLPHYNDASTLSTLLKLFGFEIIEAHTHLDIYRQQAVPYVGVIAKKVRPVNRQLAEILDTKACEEERELKPYLTGPWLTPELLKTFQNSYLPFASQFSDMVKELFENDEKGKEVEDNEESS